MKILMLTSSYDPLTGGAETYARLLCEELAAQGHQVVVVTDGSWLPQLDFEETNGLLRIVRLRSFNEMVESRDNVKWREMQFSVLGELGRHLKDEAFDVVHANSFETAILASMIAAHLGTALVASLHEQNPDKGKFGIGVCKLVYQYLPVDLYLAASTFYKNRAAQFGVAEEKIRLIYHGVPDIRVAQSERKQFRDFLGVNDSDQLILLPGRIYERKAQLDLIKSLPFVVSKSPSVKVVLAGRVSDFEYEKRVHKEIQKLGLANLVRIEEGIQTSRIPALFASADIVVQPSLEEGLGLAAIEAMMAEKPVVATNVTGLAEVITNEVDGLLVPISSPELLGAAVLRLLNDHQLAKRLAAQAKNTATRRFSLDSMVEATLNAYKFASIGLRGAN